MNFDGLAGNDWSSILEIDPGGPNDHIINSWGSSAPVGGTLIFPGAADTANIGLNVTLSVPVNVQKLVVTGTLTGNWFPGIFTEHASVVLSDGVYSYVTVSGLLQDIDLSTESPIVTLNGGGEIKNISLSIAGSSVHSAVTWDNEDTLDGEVYVSGGATAVDYSTFVNGNLLNATQGGFSGYWHITNTSTITTSAASGFSFDGGIVVNNVGGTISAVGGAATMGLQLTTIEGGTLKSSNGGAFVFSGAETLDGSASALAVDATINIGSADGITSGADITLEGAINFSAATKINFGANGYIHLHGGGYAFVNGMWVDANLQGATGADTLANAGTISSQIGSLTIEGLTLTNTGTIDATNYLADSFQIVIGGDDLLGSGSTTVVNKNLLEATGGGNIYIENIGGSQTVVDDALGGTIFADDGSMVQVVAGARLFGGEVRTQGAGLLSVGSGGILDGTSAAGLTIDAGSKVEGSPLLLVGTIVDNGSISSPIIAIASGTSAALNGVGVLSGFSLSGYGSSNAGSLTIGAGQTVHGGVSASDNGYTLINYGDVQDTDASAAFSAGGSGAGLFHNYGTYEVAANKTLTIANYGNAGTLSFINDATGHLIADAAAQIDIGTEQAVVNNGVLDANGGTITVDDAVTGTGSLLITAGGSVVFTASSSSFAQNVTFQGAGSLALSTNYAGVVTGFGVGDTISYTNTAQATLNGSGGVVNLNGSQLSLTGGADTLNFTGGSGDAASLINTGGAWDNVYGLNNTAGVTYLTAAQAQVWGGGETVQFHAGAGDAAHLLNTGANWDIVNAANATTGTVYLDSALSQVWGGGDVVYFWKGAGDAANLVNANGVWDTIYNANGTTGTVYLTNALAGIVGGGDTIYYWSGTGNGVNVANTGGVWDNVYGANGASGTTYLSSGQAQIWGGAENVVMYSGTGDAAHLLNTGSAWDVVTAANGTRGTVYVDSALAQVWGGGQTIAFWGGTGNAVNLLNTGSTADVVTNANGAKGTVYLSNASASISGGGETVDFHTGTGNVASLTGNSYALLFEQASFGLDTVNGFNATDSLLFAAADQGHLTVSHSGANTLITLDASDVVTLANYSGAVTFNYHA